MLPEIPNLSGELTRFLGQVPAGQITTYGALADALGNRIAARWVGHFTLHHPHHAQCPCHRVVRATGELGGYVTGGADEKAKRLEADGVPVESGVVDLARFGFDPGRFVGDRPLERLERFQKELTAKVSLCARRRPPVTIGGVDVSYPSPDEGVAGYALAELESGRVVWSTTVRGSIRFPYITGYLAFRELPILLSLLKAVREAGRLADVLLVDGSGILHPHRAGVASHLGVVASMPTIGVTKRLLCGEVQLQGLLPDESRLVLQENRPAGVALRPTSTSRRPIFVSPGHRMTLALAESVVRRLLLGRRLPEPLYWADRLSRQAGR